MVKKSAINRMSYNAIAKVREIQRKVQANNKSKLNGISVRVVK